jgi:hypothetical protein
MRLISVTRIFNEDDIAEAFVRHNAAHLSHMVFLDNGSTDRTLEILKSLQSEGFPLSVFQARAVTFDEVAVNTFLYHHTTRLHGADWVMFLDADEFITGAMLAPTLAAITAPAIAVPLLHYAQTGQEDPAEPIPPLRMRWRRIAPTNVHKIFLRGSLPAVTIEAGNHGALARGQKLPMDTAHPIALAHYPRRNGWQNLQKIAIGWLKTLAAGEAVTSQERSLHYRSPFETLRDKPAELLNNPAYLDRELDPSEAEEAPLNYLGGPLRYTQPTDPALKAFELGLRYAEQLARQHGRLVDGSAEARKLLEAWKNERKFLF